jgi:hypothetical protein
MVLEEGSEYDMSLRYRGCWFWKLAQIGVCSFTLKKSEREGPFVNWPPLTLSMA